MNNVRKIWINGKEQSQIQANDRGLAFGDGLFETMLWNGRTLLHVPEHLQRLQEGLGRLEIPCNIDDIQHDLLVAEEYCNAQGGRYAVKLIVTRGPASFGYLPPQTSLPTRVVMILALPNRVESAFLRATISSVRLASQPLLAGIKHCNRLEYILARQAAEQLGYDECILLDENNNVIEASSSNIFILEHGCLLTPFIEHCGVDGIMRKFVFENADSLSGLPVFESIISLERLREADGAIICNSIHGVRILSTCDETTWSIDPRLQLLKQSIDKVVYA